MSKKDYVLDQLTEDIPNEDYNKNWCFYKERSHELIRKGFPGFIIGFLVIIIAFCIFAFSGSESYPIGEIIVGIVSMTIVAVIFAIACAGFPYGWGLISNFLSRWTIYGNILIILFLFMLKLAFSFWIGMIAYPITLVYNLIRSQKSRRKVRLWTIIVISVVVLWNVFLGVCAIIDASTNSTENTEPPVVQTVDVSTFDNQADLLDAVYQKALDSTKETEKKYIDDYGWSITSPTQIHGVFFLNAKDPENPHRNILKKLDVSNAIVVVTGYYLEDAGITINQWEMDAWFYPNYCFDQNGTLSYDAENVYNDSLRSDDMDDFMEWFNSEYSDMTITEINIPAT